MIVNCINHQNQSHCEAQDVEHAADGDDDGNDDDDDDDDDCVDAADDDYDDDDVEMMNIMMIDCLFGAL